MDRRAFLGGVVLLAAPPSAEAQASVKTPRLGYVTSTTRTGNVDAFEQGLRELGYTIGENIIVEYRFGEGRVERGR